jgi:peptide/nickel transport system permease protein
VELLFRNPLLTAQQIQQLNVQFGLDQPLYIQFIIFLKNVFEGQWGFSFFFRVPVSQVLFVALLNSIILLIPSTILAIIVGVGLGIVSGWKRDSASDVGILASSLVLYAVPTFWLGMLFIMMALNFHGLPVSGMATVGQSYPSTLAYVSDVLEHLFLPTLTLTLVTLGEFTIIMRSSVLSQLTEDYVVAAAAKGMSGSRLLRKHIVPNAMLPTVTIIAISIGTVVAGAVLTETVFSWPGVGSLIYDSITRRDYPVLQGAFLVIAAVVILSNFVADLFYAYLDPRVRYD